MKKLYFSILATLSLGVASAQPVITLQPQPQTTCVNDCVNLEVQAVGIALQYRWYEIIAQDTTAIAGAIMPDLEYCNTAIENDGVSLICSVKDSTGAEVWSNAVAVAIDSCIPPVADFTWEWNHLELCFTSTSTNADDVFWLFGDGSTDASNSPEICHTYGTKEIYYVSLQVFNDHGMDEIEKVIDLLGTEEIATNLQVYPNPAKGQFFVNADFLLKEVRMYDVTGSLVLTQSINASAATLSVSELPAGVYQVSLESDKGLLSRRLVVQ